MSEVVTTWNTSGAFDTNVTTEVNMYSHEIDELINHINGTTTPQLTASSLHSDARLKITIVGSISVAQANNLNSGANGQDYTSLFYNRTNC